MSVGAAELRQLREEKAGPTIPRTTTSNGDVFELNTPSGPAYEAWCRAAFEGEIDALRSAPIGERNRRLNKSAFNIGQLAAGGHVDEVTALAELERVALSIKLTKREVALTIASGFGDGKKEPRVYEPREGAKQRRGVDLPDEDRRLDRLREQARKAEHEQDWPALVTVAGELVRATNSQPVAEGFPLVGVGELWAPLEAPAYLVDGVLTRGCLAQLVAYGSGAKTWLAVELAMAVDSGTAWLGRFDTEAGRVAYLDWENGSYELRRRLQAVGTARRLPPPQNLAASFFPPVYLTSPKCEGAMTELAKSHDLVIVDTLRAASPGVDENASEIREGLDVLRRVGEQTGCTFVVLHHSKKTSGSLTKIDAREAGRGSSAIFDAADVVLHITYDAGREPAFEVVQTKARNGKAAEPFGVTIRDVDGGVRLDAEDLPDTSTAETDAAAAKFEALCELVLEGVRQHPGLPRGELRERLGKRSAAVQAALERLERDGAVVNVGTDRRPKWMPVVRA